MQHSYEGLDRGGGFTRVGLLAPLRHRDFRLLWSGMCIDLRGTAAELGLVFAAGGIGSVVCAVALSQHGLPKRDITWMYVFWTLATLAIAGYGLAHALWGLMLASLAFNALETAGTIIWATAKQRHVPASLLGRVSSLDWLISIGLLPLSFALTAPLSSALGVRTTLIGAGVIGAIVTCAALFVPGVRAIEGSHSEQRRDVLQRPRESC